MRKGERRGSLTDTSDGTFSEMGSDDDYGGHPEDTESEDEPILECHSASAGPVRPPLPHLAPHITGPAYRPLTVPPPTPTNSLLASQSNRRSHRSPDGRFRSSRKLRRRRASRLSSSRPPT